MAFSSRSFAAFWAWATFAAAASCGGADAASGPSSDLDAGPGADALADTAPPPMACTAPKSACGGACVDTSTDTKNCGACGTACKGAERCLASTCTLVSGFAARKVFLGETDRTGTAVANAWKMYGRDIDGITSIGGTDGGECKRIAGAPASNQTDGDNGIDNAFGKTVLGFLLGLFPTPTASSNMLLELGGRTPLLQFGVPPQQAGAAPFALFTAENTVAPKWDGNDSRPIAESSTSAGYPKTLFAKATVTGGLLSSGDSSTPYVLSFPFGGGSGLEIPIRAARITMTIAADGKTASNGTISGVINTEELVTSFAKSAGGISTQLCSGSTLDAIKQTIRQASDILDDGKQDPTKDCNAISIGVGFEAVAVAVGPVAGPVAPGADPCK
jgi:hypothetical protein